MLLILTSQYTTWADWLGWRVGDPRLGLVNILDYLNEFGPVTYKYFIIISKLGRIFYLLVRFCDIPT